MAETEFKIIRNLEYIEFAGEPVGAFRYLREETREKSSSFTYIIVDDYIEDPEVIDFFFVLQKLNDAGNLPAFGEQYLWLCERNGVQYLCEWIDETVAGFGKFALPLVRRIYPTLIAQKLVAVQPMMQPASLIFYLKHKYAKTKSS